MKSHRTTLITPRLRQPTRLALLAATLSAPSAILSGCTQQHYYIKGRLDVVISDSPFPVPPDLSLSTTPEAP